MADNGTRRSLAEHRRRRFLTIRALAERARVSTNTVVAIEHGHKVPRFATMQKIADALGVEPLAVAEFAAIVVGTGTGKAAA